MVHRGMPGYSVLSFSASLRVSLLLANDLQWKRLLNLWSPIGIDALRMRHSRPRLSAPSLIFVATAHV